jgi:DNA-directed RNA polymerase specialized sigma24 family protein
MRAANQDLLDHLGRAQASCQDAWRWLVRYYERYVYRILYLRLSPQVRPRISDSDASQEIWKGVFIKLLPGEAEWTPEQFLALLRKIAENTIDKINRDHLDAAKRSRKAESPLPSEIQDRAPTPDQHAQASDLWDRFLAVSRPEVRTALLVMRSGGSTLEAARVAGVSYRELATALRRLREARASGQLKSPFDDPDAPARVG